ncbi:MAG TPA: ANTAR domain-containing protein [Pseudonocardiaceae bacterium]|nr:ANTAR domain-containing protein [Pseudonocardiaceae bacterium]
MTDDPRDRLRSMVANGDGSSPALSRICALAVSELAVSGVGLTLVDRDDGVDPHQRLVRATDPVAARLEDLQLTVGEGPGLAAVASGAAVLVPDLAAARARWPAFTAEAAQAGVSAVFAFPLALGAIRLGSLDCYRTSTGPLTVRQAGDALVLAEMAFAAVLAEVAGHDQDDLGWISDIHAEVHQASGVVMYELGITMQAALLRIRAYAYANELPIAVVAGRIVNHELSLDTQERRKNE